MPTAIVPVIVFLTVVFLILALVTPEESVLEERLRDYGYSARGQNLNIPFGQRVLKPSIARAGALIGRLSPTLISENTRMRLTQAGYVANVSATTFLTVKLALAIALPLVLNLAALIRGEVSTRTLVTVGILGILGWKLPEFWLGGKISTRRSVIERSLPDAVDLIVVAVEAGNALEAALGTVTQKIRGPLADELTRTLREISLGRPFREALRELGHRSNVADLQSFIAAILQAEQLGVSIGQTLRIQADAMRIRRRQRAEEQAAKLPVKMLFPLIVLIFPALMIVLLGPAVLQIIGFLSHTASF